MLSLCGCFPGVMFSRRWGFGWDSYSEVDLFTDRYDASAETLSQAIRAAASEEPDADGSVPFGHLQGTVVGLRFYTGVVRIEHFYSSSARVSKPFTEGHKQKTIRRAGPLGEVRCIASLVKL